MKCILGDVILQFYVLTPHIRFLYCVVTIRVTSVCFLSARSRLSEEFTYNELKDAHWLFDTPGIMKENDVSLFCILDSTYIMTSQLLVLMLSLPLSLFQILNLMTEQEVMSVVPSQAVIPRTFVLKPGTTLFVGALARIDYLQVMTLRPVS